MAQSPPASGLLGDLPKLDDFPFPFPKLGLPLFGDGAEHQRSSDSAPPSPFQGLDLPLFGNGLTGATGATGTTGRAAGAPATGQGPVDSQAGLGALPKLGLPLFGDANGKGPGSSPFSMGGLHIGRLGSGILSEQIQEQIHTRPDGTVCKTTLVVVNGKEKSRASDAL